MSEAETVRKTYLHFGLRGDRDASAPFAVVAVVLLIGAGVAYAAVAHYESSRLVLEGRPGITDGAMEALTAESRQLESLADRALGQALSRMDPAPSGTIVSAIGDITEDLFIESVRDHYPSGRGPLRVRVREPRLTVTPVYGLVEAGNALGQQTLQRLPVGVQAAAAAVLEVSPGSTTICLRDFKTVVARPAPQVLAAHLQNILEYSLADEGLVPLLVADAISANLAEDGTTHPKENTIVNTLKAAISTAEMVLFRQKSYSLFNPAFTADQEYVEFLPAPAIVGLSSPGRVVVQVPEDWRFDVRFPPTGQVLEYSLLPDVALMSSPEMRFSSVDLAPAEADGHDGTTLFRLEYALQLPHQVKCYIGEERVGSVYRDIAARATLTTYAMDRPGLEVGDFKGPQVEDWRDFEDTMAVASTTAGSLGFKLEGEPEGPSTVYLDGVYLGEFTGKEINIPNVPLGLHDLTVRSGSGGNGAVSGRAQVELVRAPTSTQRVELEEASADEAGEFAFWFSTMAAFHQGDEAGVPHLEHIAAIAGYQPLAPRVAAAPGEHLEELAFWTEGLERHLELLGDRWDALNALSQDCALDQAKELVSISKLTFTLLVELPEKVRKMGKAVLMVSQEGTRSVFYAKIVSEERSWELFRAETRDEGLLVTLRTAGGQVTKVVGKALSAISLILTGLSVCFDTVELCEAAQDGNGTRVAWGTLGLSFDIAKLVISVVKLCASLTKFSLTILGKGALTVITAAITVVTTFLSAYREAGDDFWGAWDLLLDPDSFSDALRTAGFFSAVASLVTTVVLTAVLPALTGATLAGAFATAVLAATGVGLIVFAVVLAVWAIFNWQKVRGWFSGTAKDEDVDAVREDLEGALRSTMELRARLNGLDAMVELQRARSERGTGLALMELRSLASGSGLIEALGRADLHHLDRGGAQARRARAAHELKYWIEVFWREVDDFVDDDDPDRDGEASEGFDDYKDTWGSKDLDYDADIIIERDIGMDTRLPQAYGNLVRFLRELDVEALEGIDVKLDIDGDVYEGGLKDWLKALGHIGGQLGWCTDALATSSREVSYVAALGGPSAYRRDLGIVEIRLSEDVPLAQVEVESNGPVMVQGELVEGSLRIDVVNGTALVIAAPGSIRTTLVGSTGMERELIPEAHGCVSKWCEVSFGEEVLDHTN
jgi:hypothetical protein